MSGTSTTSSRSLRSQGPVVDPLRIGDRQTSKARKKASQWNDEETTALLEYLITELPRAGDGNNFKKVTWTGAASLMAARFTVTKGGDKDSEACERRFQLASSYLIIGCRVGQTGVSAKKTNR
jgi:hypothetical protein